MKKLYPLYRDNHAQNAAIISSLFGVRVQAIKATGAAQIGPDCFVSVQSVVEADLIEDINRLRATLDCLKD